MAGKYYVRGFLLALLWWALLLAALYAVALFAPKPWNMRGLIVFVAASWPLLAGFSIGWHNGKTSGGSGFAAALRGVATPLLLLAALWWWLFPELWQAALYGKFALYVIIAALFSGGLGAGIVKARQALYPPRSADTVDDTDDEDIDET